MILPVKEYPAKCACVCVTGRVYLVLQRKYHVNINAKHKIH